MSVASRNDGLRVGFVTGSLTRIGSGLTEAQPLARALRELGCATVGLQTSRFRRSVVHLHGLTVHIEPLVPQLLQQPALAAAVAAQRIDKEAGHLRGGNLAPYQVAVGQTALRLAERLQLDLLYAFHNTNVAAVLPGWPHPSRILAINLIGFGIDPSRGGAVDTFPLQRLVFQRPYWDLHITATRFEFEQYRNVYERLGLDPSSLVYLPHSYDEDRFRPALDEGKPDGMEFDPESTILFYPVNVYPRKNIELAIDVLARLSEQIDARLVVSGQIWDRAYHGRLLQRAGEQAVTERVHFVGGISEKAMIQLYRRADVTLFTSHQETYGIGIVESLGCGTPVVGPDWIIPCAEILAESPGGWAASKDPDAFAARVLEALRTLHPPEEIAEAARARYGNSVVALQFMEVVQPIRKRKKEYAGRLKKIDWKSLYCDTGDLL